MSCNIKLLKTILAILNAVLSILGIGLIALSVYELNSSTPGTIEHIAIIVQIFIGSFVILTSFLGCFGLCRISSSIIWSYIICMIILLGFQMYIIIAAHSTDYEQNAINDFENLWNGSTINMIQVAEIEQKYHCCGRNNSLDYIPLRQPIPRSCFKHMDKITENRFTEGCLEGLRRNSVQSGATGLMIKWTLFFVELISLGFAGLMTITIRNKKRRDMFGH